MQKALGGCQKDWCDMWTLSPLMMLLMLCQAEPDQTYWAYVPDPPILHLAVWDGPEIILRRLGLPSDGHIKQQLEKNFTYNGIGLGLPICIANNRSTSWCLRSSPVTMHINDSLVGWTVRLNKRLKLNIETVPWRDCPGNDPVRYDIPGTGRYIINWSRSNQSGWARKLTSGFWTSDTQYQQNSLWRLMGVMGEVVQIVEFCKSGTPCSHVSVLKDGTRDWTTVAKTVNISACVPSPYALLIGNVNVHFIGNQFSVSCSNCSLANCISWVPLGTHVMILKQPSFVMLPVNISGPWYAERSLQVLKKLSML
ncbi:endogenous retrovirus group K member 113 Env polyprotein-like [Rhinolophus sinicus]|uniref:endogenous retrovirus group K member 113 Env polyprotein-like n=1 Tax=Rhinolophus sinicus TaxID=89399 RepID=UPI003D7998D0